jgi:altronate hydrolase
MKKNDIQTIRLNKEDNVVIAKRHLDTKHRIENDDVVTRDPIPSGHKVATCAIRKGEYIRKYGQIVGVASQDIQEGDHVHTHNIHMSEFSRDYSVGADTRSTEYFLENEQASFDGIVRKNGQVGTRNYIGVVPSVACSASICRFIADAFTDEILADYPNIDGVVVLLKPTGAEPQPTVKGLISFNVA